ncbi:MAG: hypothetical protein JWR05_3434 [Mucilaginibacter sp.]|nr:hypothetical protein [Mucilaginibacter sp.]
MDYLYESHDLMAFIIKLNNESIYIDFSTCIYGNYGASTGHNQYGETNN